MRHIFMIIALILLVVAPISSFASPTQSTAEASARVTPEKLSEFEAIIQAEMEFYNIPGMGVAIVEGNETIYAEGFGSRNLAKNEPFTPETRFRIGSTTKSMTSMLVAQLVDEGLLDWDTRIIDIYPDFRTIDPELTVKIRVRDLLGMNTSLESNPIEFIKGVQVWTVEDLFTAISVLETGGEFGEYYSYNNEVYASMGYIATQQAGYKPTLANYNKIMTERIFAPLGMDHSIITDDLALLGNNYATSYEMQLIDDPLTPYEVQPAPIGVIAPAGAAWSTLEDMSRYVITQMQGGLTPEGEQIVSTENLSETWQSQVAMQAGLPGLTDMGYGMGWITLNYQEIPVLYHDGGWEGYRTQMVIFPEAEVGLIILTNHVFGDQLNSALTYAFTELIYDLEPTAIELFHASFTETFGSIGSQLQALPPIEVNPEDVSALLGEYEDNWTMELDEDNTLWLTRPGWEFMLRPLPFDGFYVIVNGLVIGTGVEFDISTQGTTLYIEPDGLALAIAKIE